MAAIALVCLALIWNVNKAARSPASKHSVSVAKASQKVAVLSKSIERDPDSADPYLKRASEYEKAGIMDQALTDANRAVQLAPTEARVRLSYAQLLEKANLKDQALREYKAVLSLNPPPGVRVTGAQRVAELERQLSAPARKALDEYFSSGVGPFKFGMTPWQVLSHLPRPLGNVSWSSLPVAGEFKSAEVRYFWVNVSTFPLPSSPDSALEAFRSWSSCWKGQSYITFLFLEGKLFRISLRLLSDCGEREALLRSFADEFGLGFEPSGSTAFDVALKATAVKGTATQEAAAVDIFTNRSPKPSS